MSTSVLTNVSDTKTEHQLDERKTWHRNGQPLVQEFYQDGEREGERKEWYANGQLWERSFYRDGKLEGKRNYWYANGQLWEQEFYRDGKEEGEYKSWYENGQLKVQSFYRNGKLEGECKKWKKNGQLKEQSFYRDDKKIKTSSLDHPKMSAQFPISTLSFGTPFCTSASVLAIDTCIRPENPAQVNHGIPFSTSANALIVDASETIAEPEKKGGSSVRFLLCCFASALIFSSVLSFSVQF